MLIEGPTRVAILRARERLPGSPSTDTGVIVLLTKGWLGHFIDE